MTPDLALESGWEVQSSAVVGADGAGEGAWIPIREPMTVGAALYEAGRVPDPYAGDGLTRWPGWRDDLRRAPMPADSPFAAPWWYRTRFSVDDPAGPALLHLDGVNDRAEVWLNGQRVAGPDTVRGTFRRFALDVTGRLQRDNLLAVKVWPQPPKGLGITWLDWGPTPPDADLGLHDRVWLERTGPVALDGPWVATRLDGDAAVLTVHAPLRALAPADVVQVEARILDPAGAEVGRWVGDAVGAEASGEVRLAAPRLWWPAGAGEQPLYTLDVRARVGGQVSDAERVRFGVREVRSELVDGVRRFLVNGRPVLIRGGGWASDLLLRRPPGKAEAQLALVRSLGLDAVRLEGMVEPEAFHARCDELGILVLAGWSCCDRWEQSGFWTGDERALAVQSLRDRIGLLRRHPSTLAFLYGSDDRPAPEVEAAYRAVLAEGWDAAVLAAASERSSTVSGPTGVKMRGPYALVVPSYWLRDRERGGAFGFATEVGPGVAVPSRRGLAALHGPGPLWPPDAVWRQHAGPATFDHLGRLDALVTAAVRPARRSGRLAPQGAARGLRRAPGDVRGVPGQRSARRDRRRRLDAHEPASRAVLERAGLGSARQPRRGRHPRGEPAAPRAAPPRRPRRGGGERDGRAGGGHRHGPGARSGRPAALRAGAHRHRARGRRVVRAGSVVVPPGRPSLVRLELRDGAGVLLDANTYALAGTPDRIAFDHRDPHTDWFVTPTERVADLSALAALPAASVAVSAERTPGGVAVTLQNGERVALSVAVAALDEAGEEVLGAVWDDGWLDLLPGEVRTVRAQLPRAAARVEVRGFNVAPTGVAL
ncbi:MAG: hypothetical protein R3F59_16750 [Myxococcota bacterium]